MMRRFQVPSCAIMLCALIACISQVITAQTPVALPYTMSTIAGGLAPASGYTSGTTICPGTSSTVMNSAYGDNCQAISGVIGAGSRSGVAVDQYGNVFVGDDINKMIHVIDPNTGVMSVVAGGGTVCSTSAGVQDKMGDGCYAVTQTSNIGARGFGLDPYGNVIIPNYSYNAIHLVCRNPSPLCTNVTPAPTTANPIQIKIGYMGIVGGCLAAATTSTSTTSGIGLDGTPGFSTYNTSTANTASYPATLSGSASAFKNSGTCSSSLGEVLAPRAAWGDIYGNIYYADTSTSRTRVILGPLTSSYFSGNNPLYAALKLNTGWTSSNLKPGYVYTVVNIQGKTVTTTTANVTVGSTCLASIKDQSATITYAYSGATPTALDTHSDGCPFFDSSVYASSGATDTAVTDAAGNLIFTDPYNATAGGGLLRVFFVQGWANTSAATSAGATGSVAAAGVAMYNAILKNNPSITPTAGYIYALAGGVNSGMNETSTASLSTVPTLGNATTFTLSTITKLAISPQGNIYIAAGSKVLFYDIYNGTIRTLLTSASSSTSTKGGYCTGSSGATAKDTLYDGCPASLAYWGATNGTASNNLPIAVDGQGNLYIEDTDSSTYGLVRKVLAQGTGSESNGTLKALASSYSISYPMQSLGTTQTQTFWVHFPYASSQSAAVTSSTNSNFSYGSPSCTRYSTSSNALYDNSMDCTIVVTYTPTAVGPQTGVITIVAAGGETVTLNLSGTVAGSSLAVDAATAGSSSILTTSALFNGYTPYAVASDNAGNIYAAIYSGSSYSIVESLAGSSGSMITLLSGISSQPTSLVVDATGNVFYLLSGTSAIQELAVSAAGSPNSYTATNLIYYPTSLATANPVALALDQSGNLLVADSQSGVSTIYVVSTGAISSTTAATCNLAATAGSIWPTLCQSAIYGISSSTYTPQAFGVISALAMDPSGNIYVADTTNSAIYKLTRTLSTSTPYINYWAESTLLSSVTATGLATDAAGDLYVQTASGVTMYSLSGVTTGVSVYSAIGSSPSGVALDGTGNVYSADSGNTYVTQVQRSSLVQSFGSDTTLIFSASLSNIGNQTSTVQGNGSSAGAEAGDFDLSGSCNLSSNLLSAMSAGSSCTLTASFPAIGDNINETDYILFTATAPATSVLGELTLTGYANQIGYYTTTAIGTTSPTTPVYSASGTEISIPITVTANSVATDGTTANTSGGPTTSQYVNVSIDSGTASPYYFTAASDLSATLTLSESGLAAGTHTITITFPQQKNFFSSTASGTFTISKASSTIVWSPGATTQQVSAAVGTSVLNAYEQNSISGYVAYAIGGAPYCSATSAVASDSTTLTPVDAATYLSLGSYTIYATFCPLDPTDYSSSGTSISYTVTRATTTAAVGSSTNVVAADGTGNYSTLSAALVALPPTGGTIYIAPGTYSGQNAVSYPNVQLRGLGGDASKVILTAEDGAFSTPFTGYDGAGSGSGNANASGDQGSSTLDVAKSYYMGQSTGSNSSALTSGLGIVNSTQYTPNNFYAEYLTVQNTWDYSATVPSYYYTNSTCTAGNPNSYSRYQLYNAGNLCNGQALALWITADQAILNHVNLISRQDTLYSGSQGSSSANSSYYVSARQYFWKGMIVGDVDYVFGDSALVFDHTSFYTTSHSGASTLTGGETIEAQNKKVQTGSTYDYLSGYICNSCVLMSQASGMTNLYYGRPYGAYSTWVMLNNQVDQVNALGWEEFSGDTNLPTSTYVEYNTTAATDTSLSAYPSTTSTLAGMSPVGGNTGSGATSFSSRETTSTNPGTIESSNSPVTQLNTMQSVQYAPLNFLSTSVNAIDLSYNESTSWNPISVIANRVNSFVPSAGGAAIPYGSSVTLLARPQTPGAGIIPTGSYVLYDSLGTNQICTSSSSTCTILANGSLDGAGETYQTFEGLATGTHYISLVYGGDTNFAASSSTTPYVLKVNASGMTATTTTLSVINTSSTYGNSITGTASVSPTVATGTMSIYVDGAATTTCTLSGGSCSWSLSGPAVGSHVIYASYLGDAIDGPSISATASVYVVAPTATGDARTVTEPSFPTTVCSALTAALASNSSNQLDESIDNTDATSNPDGARIQAALNSCSTTATAAGTQMAVELSLDSTGTKNAFLSGPLTIPSYVVLLVDPNVTLYFSRNARDYDKTYASTGTYSCGTISAASNTASCYSVISIPAGTTYAGIMGYGKLDGRGYANLRNTFTTSGYAMPSTPTWWNLSDQANGEGSQQNPRFIQISGSSSSATNNITLYKITLMNPPMFHVALSSVDSFTAWGIKIVTPTYARNTDGIDPGGVTNSTIAYSWISDGDDDVAVGASNAASKNISIVHNRFFAGHGESIGSYTNYGVSNILFDDNILAGNYVSGAGSAISQAYTINSTAYAANYADGNSTAVHIKTANDRGSTVSNIQYSNSCFLNHKVDVQFTPYYNSTDGTKNPSMTNILMQNLVFQNSNSSSGTVELTGEYDSTVSVTNPLGITMDNVTYASALSSLVGSTANAYTWSGGTGQYTNLTIGPGTVSSNFYTAYQKLLPGTSTYHDTLTNNISQPNLSARSCTYTYVAPELTGPKGVAQTIQYGNTANVVVILTPAVGGAAYPTGTVTVNDTTTGNTYTGTLSGTGDTLVVTIPVADLILGTHTFTATYTGDSNYTIPSSLQTFGSYNITVTQATPTITWAPSTSLAYGTSLNGQLNATATNGSSAAVDGTFTYTATPTSGGSAVAVTASSVLATGTYTLTVNFTPTDTTDYASVSSSVTLSVTQTIPVITLSATATTSVLQNAVAFTAKVASSVSTPTGTVAFYSNSTTTLGSCTLASGSCSLSVSTLAAGSNTITAAYSGDTNYATVTSSSITETVITVSVGTVSSGSGSTGSGSGSTQSILPGGTASWDLPILPSSGSSFPIDVTLSISGLPTGATATVSPTAWTKTSSTLWTLPAGTSLTADTVLKVAVSSSSAASHPKQTPGLKPFAPMVLALLLLPFAGRIRRSGRYVSRTIALLLLLAAGLATAGISGCGSGGGAFNQGQQSYSINVTVTAGTLTKTTTLNLSVQ